MPEMMKYIIDAAVGAALFVALLIVFAVDAFLTYRGSAIGENTLTNVKVLGGEKRETKKLKLAVTPSIGSKLAGVNQPWDDMGKLLNGLGEGFRYDDLPIDELIRKHE